MSLFVAAAAFAADPLMYVGTYTGQGSEGIYVYRFNPQTGAVTPIGLAAKSNSPSFLAVAPGNRVLYAVNEVNTGQNRSGGVSAFSINRSTGMLTALNQVSSGGPGPCFVTVDAKNRAVLAANYGGGSIASFRIVNGGRLSEAVSFIQHKGSSASPRQREPHAHSINVSPDQRYAVAADLGTDELLVYRFDSQTAKLTANSPPSTKMAPGSGPRHFTFHPNKRWAYAINEILSTVTALQWDAANGALAAVDTVSTLPEALKVDNNSTAEVQVHKSGKWLYGSNRGHDSIAVFEIDRISGKLKLVQNAPTGGSAPRNFRIDPSGKWLIAANHRGNNMNVFRIDPKSGKLTQTGDPVKLVSPVCIKFVP